MQTHLTTLRRRTSRWIPLLAVAGFTHGSDAADFPADPTGWPAVTATSKPWTRWWWLGSAVDKPNLTRQLEEFAKTGIGGVEICPIYGAKGAENRFVDFLSPGWMEMLAHTTTEAKRLGLGVDMTTGTGWPFGGPQVTPEIASESLQTRHWTVDGGGTKELGMPEGKLICLRAFPAEGTAIDLTGKVVAGRLEWQAPPGRWTVVALAASSPIQKVKRSAPGGEGNVLDPFSSEAMASYVTTFDRAFTSYQAPWPRAQFHDSFEYYQAAWTPKLLETFRTRRGYDLRDQLPALIGEGAADQVTRVRSDYRETLGELHLGYLERWHEWARGHGGITRNQAHGSPGNLLDHYAVSEIPETEIFRHVDESQIPMMRMAVSAAHSKGSTLVSAEAFTWLDEHFQVTPDELKGAADFVFLSGVNHLFFHGIPYSPEDVPWPGWLFYASTHLGPQGGLWHDLPTFTAYLQRCQSILQQGKPSTDVLIYFPIHDMWAQPAKTLTLFTLHNQDEWLQPTPFHQTSMRLLQQGVSFDYASADMLSRATVKEGRWQLGGNSYRSLILPGVKRLPPAVMEHLARLAAAGAPLVVEGGWPTEVPGWADRESRLAQLNEATQAAAKGPAVRLTDAETLMDTLNAAGVRPEPMTAAGLRFVRREFEGGYHYFIANRGSTVFDGPLTLAVPFRSAVILDPWQPQHPRTVAGAAIELRLEPGESVILRTFDKPSDHPATPPLPALVRETALDGPWQLEFVQGGPELPPAVASTSPGSWTALSGNAYQNFSGTGRYTTTFDLTSPLPARCVLDLGEVAQTARISVNGKAVGVSWSSPHRIDLTAALKPGSNQLVVEVTNLAANRIADLDRRGVPWKQFHEINFVNIDYKPFDASQWQPLESGLLGPVKLRMAAGD